MDKQRSKSFRQKVQWLYPTDQATKLAKNISICKSGLLIFFFTAD